MFGLLTTPQLQTARPSPVSQLQARFREPVPTTHRPAFVPYAAKKKGGGKKNGGGNPFKGKKTLVPEKKVTLDPTASATVVMHSLQMIECYRKAAEGPLLEGLDIAVAAKALFEAPFALITCTAAESPAMDYANKVALEALGYTWDDFIELSAVSIIPEAAQGSWGETIKQMESGLVDVQGPRLNKEGEEIIFEDGQGWPIKTGSDEVIGYAVKWTPPQPEEEEEAAMGEAVEERETQGAAAVTEEAS